MCGSVWLPLTLSNCTHTHTQSSPWPLFGAGRDEAVAALTSRLPPLRRFCLCPNRFYYLHRGKKTSMKSNHILSDFTYLCASTASPHTDQKVQINNKMYIWRWVFVVTINVIIMIIVMVISSSSICKWRKLQQVLWQWLNAIWAELLHQNPGIKNI